MFLTPPDISEIPGVSIVTGQNLSEAKSQHIRRHPRGYGPDTTFAPEIFKTFEVCLSGVRQYVGFWLLTSFGQWCRTPQVFSRYHGVSKTYPFRGCWPDTPACPWIRKRFSRRQTPGYFRDIAGCQKHTFLGGVGHIPRGATAPLKPPRGLCPLQPPF